jgi:hypothetical protein
MKKIITGFLIILIIFNFIFASGVYADQADTDEKTSTYTQSAPVSDTLGAELVEDGTVSQTQDSATKVTTTALSFGSSIIGFITGILARLINVFIALQIDIIMSDLTASTEYSSAVSSSSGDFQFWFSIDRAVFNRVALFNINYFNTDSTYKVGDTEIVANNSNILIKKSITDVYYICRILALSIGLLVLIYIGIRMAISTVASDQAKYKKMLVSWIESVILIFLMPYIISAIFTFGEIITGMFYNIRNSLLGVSAAGTAGTYDIFEDTIRDEAFCALFEKSGLQLTLWSIIYWCLLFTEMKFLWTYLKRFLMVGFLIIISPLITITYSIDKVGDGKAQAFSTWLKEFTVNVLIQPLHALIYLIFVLTANSIAASSPLVALAMLMAMGQVERMVKVIFDLRGLVTLRGVDKFLKKEG